MFERLQRTIDPIEPESFLRLDDNVLKSCVFSRQKAGYGRDLAAAILEGSFDPHSVEAAADSEATQLLASLREIGIWTAESYLLWALGRRDVFPAGDLALQVEWQRLSGSERRPSAKQLREIAEQWRPRRSAAALLLWYSYLADRPRDGATG